MSSIEIRELSNIFDYFKCAEIQKKAWGFESDIDVVPPPIFVLSRDFGGVVLGAFKEDKLIGFSLAFPLFHGKKIVLHSHMTAVLPQYQGKGAGKELKLKQRETALKKGYDTITWTFDPFHTKNAYFNFKKLGILVKDVKPNFYGKLSSKDSKGIPTHRFLAFWELNSKKVLRTIKNEDKKEVPKLKIYSDYTYSFLPEENSFLIEIPCNFRELKNHIKIYNRFIEFSEKIIKNGFIFYDFIKDERGCFYHLKKE